MKFNLKYKFINNIVQAWKLCFLDKHFELGCWLLELFRLRSPIRCLISEISCQ